MSKTKTAPAAKKAPNSKARPGSEAGPLHDAGALEALRADLDAKRKEVLSLYEHDLHAGQETADDNADDFADRANNSFNRELMFSLSDNERQILIRIDDAFQRLDDGSYGICAHCSEPIGLPRLQALPWASYCIGCQEREEMGLLDA